MQHPSSETARVYLPRESNDEPQLRTLEKNRDQFESLSEF
jgi:hypothetical protein